MARDAPAEPSRMLEAGGSLMGNWGLQCPAKGCPTETCSFFHPHSVKQHNARDAQRRYYHKAFKEKRKDPSIFPHPKGQEVLGERELLSSLKSHCCGSCCMWWCTIIVTIVFNKAPTDPFLPYPAKVSQATPLRTFAPILTAHLIASPQGSVSRFIQFWLNSELSPTSKVTWGKLKGKHQTTPSCLK